MSSKKTLIKFELYTHPPTCTCIEMCVCVYWASVVQSERDYVTATTT